MKACALMVLVAVPCFAEAGWLSARGRLQPETRLEAWLGTRTVGAGALKSDEGSATAAVSVEGLWSYVDRFFEVRAARVWQFSATRFATGGVSLGGSATFVPDAGVVGAGPHGTVSLSLGGAVFAVDLGLQTGAEVFTSAQPVRLVERALIGAHVRAGHFVVSVMARAGADVIPNHPFVGRAEAVVAVGWTDGR